MRLDLLTSRTAGAAENMAVDFLLLQRYAEPTHARFRHYEWRAPAFTFGYGQKIDYVRAQLAMLAPGEHVDLTRRPTGGGVVDHRDDWTFALVIPRGHTLYDVRATESYRAVHAELVEALRALGQDVILKDRCDCAVTGEPGTAVEDEEEARVSRGARASGPTVCFARPELYDVLRAGDGRKVAGAAQKRSKHGLLFQGSVAKAVLGEVDWDRFEAEFTTRLASMLGFAATPTPWPEFAEGELDGLAEQYASSEWIEHR